MIMCYKGLQLKKGVLFLGIKKTIYLDEKMQETINLAKEKSFNDNALELTTTSVIRQALEVLRRELLKNKKKGGSHASKQ